MNSINEMYDKLMTTQASTDNNQKKLMQAYESILKTESGKLVLASIIQASGVFSSPQAGASIEAFLGARSIGLWLMSQLELSNKDLFNELMNFYFVQKQNQTKRAN